MRDAFNTNVRDALVLKNKFLLLLKKLHGQLIYVMYEGLHIWTSVQWTYRYCKGINLKCTLSKLELTQLSTAAQKNTIEVIPQNKFIFARLETI